MTGGGEEEDKIEKAITDLFKVFFVKKKKKKKRKIKEKLNKKGEGEPRKQQKKTKK